MAPVDISLVIPAYNEAAGLPRAVEAARSALAPLGSFEIILAEDGSTDGTDRAAADLAERFPDVRHLHSDRRLGRGGALRRAFAESRGGILAYMDVDLATDVAHLPALVGAVRDGADAATGSRRVPGSAAERSPKRSFLSGAYNGWVRLWLGSGVRDHQCGFKAFRRESLLPLLGRVRSDGWFWDTETLVLAQRAGMKVVEIPVRWREQRRTKVRLGRDILGLARSVVALWWRLRREGRSRAAP
ncbi:MAG: glycosyltransferase family 2 protein [Halobacteria archaeon]